MTIFIDSVPGKGRGMFAAKDFKKDEIIEVCPVYIIPEKDFELFEKTQFTNYLFAWGEDDEGYCVCLGYGSIYNHSFEPNIEFETDMKNMTIVFKALRDIAKGEELCSDYNYDDDAEVEEWYSEGKKKYPKKPDEEKTAEEQELELNKKVARDEDIDCEC